MKHKSTLLLMVTLLTTIATHAYNFQSGDLYYDITSATTVEVTYQVQYSLDNYQGLTTATIPEIVTSYNGTTYSVTSIGDLAFHDCSSLTSITIPNSVTSIGHCAFQGCSSLTSITTPNSVTSIGNYAFSGCSSLTSITLPNSVTSIGWDAFYEVPNIVYSGTATGSPWGARSVNGYVDGYLVYADETKTTLLACSAAATGEVTIPNSVTSIGSCAFKTCSSLTSITIPENVKHIGGSVFSNCTGLTSVVWNAINCSNDVGDGSGNIYLIFKNSNAHITSFTLGEKVEVIPGTLCYGLSELTSIRIPKSVKTIGSYAFCNCSGLNAIALPENVSTIYGAAFQGCTNITSIAIPQNVRLISPYTFADCVNLSTVTMPNEIDTIGRYAFSYCKSLTDFSLPTATTIIGTGCFYNCSNLTSLLLPENVTTVNDSAFYGCSSLTSITLLNSVTSIGSRAFYNCSSLTSIILPNSVTSIGEWAFHGCSSLTSIILPNSVTRIGDWVFYGCSSLTSVTIPNSVTSIGDYAFVGCSSLTSITIPNSVMSIGFLAFEDCSSLTSITIPNSVTSIGDLAFNDCSSLTSVTSLSCTPPSCGSNVFNYTPSEKILVVPSISMDAYKNSSTWKDFTSFEKCLSVFVQSSDSTLGVAQIDQEVDCDSVAIISAVGNPGSAFTQWSDGNTDNPRTIKLTQDTTFVAEFEMDYSGKCGDELYWAYSNQEIKITGTGAMYNYTDSTMPWTLLRDSIKTVRVGNNATSIGAYAFANTPKLAELHIGINVEEIGANAFAGCKRLYDIYCYPTYPPFAEGNSFANYNVYVYLPCESQRDYTLDVVWGEFKFIECIGSENVVVSGNEVTVSPDYEDATFTWPVTDNADTYSLVITKDGVTFCTLVFNAQGKLASIAFKPRRQNAPAAEGTTPATYAEMTANGFRFTVTGLDEGSAYAYTLTVRSAANTVLETYTGEFTTLSNTPMGINESAGEDAHAHGQVEKIIRDGQVLILRNGETYDMMGQTL